MRKALLFLAVPLLAAGYGRAADKPSSERPTTVRFLCVSADIPSKFNRLPNGFYVPIPFSFDERPPMSVWRKEGEVYKPVPFVQSGVSRPLVISDKKQGASGGFYFQGVATAESADAVLSHSAGTSGSDKPAPGAGKPEKKVETWHLLAECPKADGKDHLICLFNPNPKAKWYPAKTLDLDISEKVFSSGQCLTINLSAKPVYVQAGEKSKPVSLAAGGAFAISDIAPDSTGEVRLKVAAALSPTKTAVVFNRSVPVVAGKRSIIVLHEAHPSANIPVDVKFFHVEGAISEQTPPAPKVASASR